MRIGQTGEKKYIVESGGYLRNGLGLSHQQWTYLLSLERANLIASRTKMDLLKDEHEICLEMDITGMQMQSKTNLILEFLQMVRDGITEVLVAGCKARIHAVFTELGSMPREPIK